MNLGEGQRWGPITYAQHGDDLFIINLFELMGIARPSYLDIGANHPFAISNTALLYQRGSRGVNVEANPDLMEAFHIHRPEDTNVNIGVAPRSGMMEFFMFRDGNGLNTFDPVERDKTIESGNPIKEIRTIQTITLNEVVQKHCYGKWPDLLSIDIEGLDYAVLDSADLRLGPKVICVETRRWNTTNMLNLLSEKDYICTARLAENLIFVSKEAFKLINPW